VCLGGAAGFESTADYTDQTGLRRDSDTTDYFLIRADVANIEEAVQARVLEQSAKDAKAQNSNVESEFIEDVIDETRRGNAGRPDGN